MEDLYCLRWWLRGASRPCKTQRKCLRGLFWSFYLNPCFPKKSFSTEVGSTEWVGGDNFPTHHKSMSFTRSDPVVYTFTLWAWHAQFWNGWSRKLGWSSSTHHQGPSQQLHENKEKGWWVNSSSQHSTWGSSHFWWSCCVKIWFDTINCQVDRSGWGEC